MPVSYIPEGYHHVTPYLVVAGAGKAIDFYKEVFGAVELSRMSGPGDKVAHAELRVGDSLIMMADEFPEMGFHSPVKLGGSPVGMLVYVPDADAVFARAMSLGAKAHRPLENQFYGDRSGQIIDPFGHHWTISTHIEDVPPDEMERRAAAWHANN